MAPRTRRQASAQPQATSLAVVDPRVAGPSTSPRRAPRASLAVTGQSSPIAVRNEPKQPVAAPSSSEIPQNPVVVEGVCRPALDAMLRVGTEGEDGRVVEWDRTLQRLFSTFKVVKNTFLDEQDFLPVTAQSTPVITLSNLATFLWSVLSSSPNDSGLFPEEAAGRLFAAARALVPHLLALRGTPDDSTLKIVLALQQQAYLADLSIADAIGSVDRPDPEPFFQPLESLPPKSAAARRFNKYCENAVAVVEKTGRDYQVLMNTWRWEETQKNCREFVRSLKLELDAPPEFESEADSQAEDEDQVAESLRSESVVAKRLGGMTPRRHSRSLSQVEGLLETDESQISSMSTQQRERVDEATRLANGLSESEVEEDDENVEASLVTPSRAGEVDLGGVDSRFQGMTQLEGDSSEDDEEEDDERDGATPRPDTRERQDTQEEEEDDSQLLSRAQELAKINLDDIGSESEAEDPSLVEVESQFATRGRELAELMKHDDTDSEAESEVEKPIIKPGAIRFQQGGLLARTEGAVPKNTGSQRAAAGPPLADEDTLAPRDNKPLHAVETDYREDDPYRDAGDFGDYEPYGDEDQWGGRDEGGRDQNEDEDEVEDGDEEEELDARTQKRDKGKQRAKSSSVLTESNSRGPRKRSLPWDPSDDEEDEYRRRQETLRQHAEAQRRRRAREDSDDRPATEEERNAAKRDKREMAILKEMEKRRREQKKAEKRRRRMLRLREGNSESADDDDDRRRSWKRARQERTPPPASNDLDGWSPRRKKKNSRRRRREDSSSDHDVALPPKGKNLYRQGREGPGARIPWTQAEEDLLMKEMREFPCKWAAIIQRHGEWGYISRKLKYRTVVSLKMATHSHVLVTRNFTSFKRIPSSIAPIQENLFAVLQSPASASLRSAFKCCLSPGSGDDFDAPPKPTTRSSSSSISSHTSAEFMARKQSWASDLVTEDTGELIYLPWAVHQSLEDQRRDKDFKAVGTTSLFILASLLVEVAHWIYTLEHETVEPASMTGSTTSLGSFNSTRSANDVGLRVLALLLGTNLEYIVFADGNEMVVKLRLPAPHPPLMKADTLQKILPPSAADVDMLDVTAYGSTRVQTIPSWFKDTIFPIIKVITVTAGCHHGTTSLE
ncbi:hypothetical protein MNV49_005974 [Pseudohyphozyma bogoriensis]|nr:hypothetical protein MNV49_005974 [Pseudohyphozyma bogoriensis]